MRFCLCSPAKDVYSETFIRAHRDRIPGTVIPLYGGWPLWEHDGRNVVSVPYRVGMRYGKRIHSGVESAARRAATRQFTSFLRGQKTDVVLAEYGTTAADLVDSCQAARTPLVAHFHGYDAYHKEILEEYAAAYRRVFETAAAIVAVSRDMERQLLSIGAPPERLHVNSCGVDLADFQPALHAAGQPLFLAVGRFVDKKAPHLTLLAFERVLARLPDARLSFAGEGPLLEACRQMAQALGIGDSVEFLGRRSHEEIAALMKRARAFVQHSVVTGYGDSEGTPVAVLEAGAAALPVISTRHGGIADAVIHGETGYLVDELDVQEMAERMIELGTDPDKAMALGRNAREWIGENYSMDKSIGVLHRILKDAAASSQSTTGR